MCEEFSVYAAYKNAKGKTVYYARFYDSSGKIIRTVSTKCTNRTAAHIYASNLLLKGLDKPKVTSDFYEYLLKFWSPGSDYYLQKEARGFKLSYKYISNNNNVIRNRFAFVFAGMAISDVRPYHLECAMSAMSAAGVNHRIINICLVAVRKAYTEYCRLMMMPDILVSVRRFAEHPKKRGILSRTEADIVLNPSRWSDKRMWTASLLASVSAMRLGEIRALRPVDLQKDEKGNVIIYLQNSWADSEGIKGLKNRKNRVIPLPTYAVEALIAIAPKSPTEFYFASTNPTKPLVSNCFLESLKKVLTDCNIDNKTRNICFHSWRHYAATNNLDFLSDRQARALTGHENIEPPRFLRRHCYKSPTAATGTSCPL